MLPRSTAALIDVKRSERQNFLRLILLFRRCGLRYCGWPIMPSEVMSQTKLVKARKAERTRRHRPMRKVVGLMPSNVGVDRISGATRQNERRTSFL